MFGGGAMGVRRKLVQLGGPAVFFVHDVSSWGSVVTCSVMCTTQATLPRNLSGTTPLHLTSAGRMVRASLALTAR
jgi:hypothetical protein